MENTVPSLYSFNRLGLALVPFTPVPFTGSDAVYAWGRLIVYSGAAALAWKRYRKLSYCLTGAAALSLVTSLGGSAWGKETKETTGPQSFFAGGK